MGFAGLSVGIALGISNGFEFREKITVPIGIGVVLTLIGLLFLWFGTRLMIFDRSRGECWKGRKAPRGIADEQELGNFVKLQDIAYLQIITKVIPSGETPYNSYELNVVLNDGSRFNAVDHGDKSRPITDREWDRLPPSAKAAYEIYQIFFRLVVGRGNVGKRFVMAQKSLRINVRETLDRTGGEPGGSYREPPQIGYELHNIRPRLTRLKHDLLYLDDYTEGQIYRFLATAPGPVKRQYGIRLDPRISREEKQKRFQFITRELVIHVVGWGDLELSLPRVFDIDFDRDLNSAVVSYRLRSSGGHELFHRVEGTWMRRREGPLRPTWHN